jgi:hypothetical protein
MVQLSATRCSYIAILWVSLVSFAAITFCVASQLVFIVVSVYFVINSVRKLLVTPSYHLCQQQNYKLLYAHFTHRPCGLFWFITSESMNPFRHFDRTPRTGDRPLERPLPTRDSTAQKNMGTIIYLEGIRTHDPSFRAIQDHTNLSPRGHWHRPIVSFPRVILRWCPSARQIPSLQYTFQSQMYNLRDCCKADHSLQLRVIQETRSLRGASAKTTDATPSWRLLHPR